MHRSLAFATTSTCPFERSVDRALQSGAERFGIDVFDTILVRRVVGDRASEGIAAHRMSETGLWPGDATAFLAARRRASRAAPGSSLLEWLSHEAFEGLASVEEALRVEVETERELLLAVDGAARALRRLRSTGSVVFVSDMHLGADVLRSLLADHGLAEPADRVVSSCDHPGSKAEGNLFVDVFGSDGATSTVFVGNNLFADGTQARLAGLRVEPANLANPTRYEASFAARPTTYGPAVAGAARLVRLEQGRLAGRDADLRSLGAEVVGQLMAGFLFWIRERCHHHGIHHVEFLARDGRLPFEMAEAMPSDHWEDFRLGYLHAGRKAWSLAAAPLVGVREFVEVGTADPASFLIHSGTLVPWLALLERCGLRPEDLPESTPLAARPLDSPLDADDVAAWTTLLRSGSLDAKIAAAAREPMELLVEFLRDRLPSDAPIALADVGWRGQQAWLISSLVREATGHEPLHLHFGGDGVVDDLDRRFRVERFALDDSVRPHPIVGPVLCLELFLASGSPRILGYRRDEDGRVERVFEDAASAAASSTQERLAEGALDLARHLPSRASLDRWGLSSTPLVDEARAVLDQFWNTPSRREAELVSGVRFENDDGGRSISAVVRGYRPSELFGRQTVPRTWRQGSLAVTAWWFRPLVALHLRRKRR